MYVYFYHFANKKVQHYRVEIYNLKNSLLHTNIATGLSNRFVVEYITIFKKHISLIVIPARK